MDIGRPGLKPQGMDTGRADGTGTLQYILTWLENHTFRPGLKPQGMDSGRADGTGIVLNLNAVGMMTIVTREFIHG